MQPPRPAPSPTTAQCGWAVRGPGSGSQAHVHKPQRTDRVSGGTEASSGFVGGLAADGSGEVFSRAGSRWERAALAGVHLPPAAHLHRLVDAGDKARPLAWSTQLRAAAPGLPGPLAESCVSSIFPPRSLFPPPQGCAQEHPCRSLLHTYAHMQTPGDPHTDVHTETQKHVHMETHRHAHRQMNTHRHTCPVVLFFSLTKEEKRQLWDLGTDSKMELCAHGHP